MKTADSRRTVRAVANPHPSRSVATPTTEIESITCAVRKLHPDCSTYTPAAQVSDLKPMLSGPQVLQQSWGSASKEKFPNNSRSVPGEGLEPSSP